MATIAQVEGLNIAQRIARRTPHDCSGRIIECRTGRIIECAVCGMLSPVRPEWVERARAHTLPAVDRTGAIRSAR